MGTVSTNTANKGVARPYIETPISLPTTPPQIIFPKEPPIEVLEVLEPPLKRYF